MRVLIVYASVHGSTAGIARYIAGVLEARGMEAAVSNASSAGSIEEYDAYVLGSAVHHGMWLHDMAAFARRLGKIQNKKPVYLWLACLRALEPNGYAYVSDNYLPNLLSRGLSFRRIGIFAGKIDPAVLDQQEAWTLTFRYDGATDPVTLSGDHRDWPAIRAWTEQIADDLAQS